MSTPHGFIEKLAELSNAGGPFVAVTLVDAVGSTPQDAGTKMLVDATGLLFGTVGGGRVENQALEFAQRMLQESDSPTTQLVEWNLQRDVGMTCGGEVKLDGFLLPGDVSVITGLSIYRFVPEEFGLACAVTGFEAADILEGILNLVRQVNADEPKVENAYPGLWPRTATPRPGRWWISISSPAIPTGAAWASSPARGSSCGRNSPPSTP